MRISGNETYSWNDIALKFDISLEYGQKNCPKFFRRMWYM